jgi:hypothetical protein
MIDVTKCFGCRKGIGCFTEKNGKYYHVDIFATSESSESYLCENSDVIGKFLYKNGKNGFILPNDDLKVIFIDQEFWWTDILTLSHDIFGNNEKVAEFFNTGEKGNMIWNLPNIDLENKLIEIAIEKGIDVIEDNYPDLLKWNQ